MKKLLILFACIVGLYGLSQIGLNTIGRFSAPNEDYLQLAKETDAPNFNFIFASNASLAGRMVMTLTPEQRKSCINTATSFYNKLNMFQRAQKRYMKKITGAALKM